MLVMLLHSVRVDLDMINKAKYVILLGLIFLANSVSINLTNMLYIIVNALW